MSRIMTYKGYYGTVETSNEDDVLFGEVIGVNGLVSYEGDSLKNLRKDFEEAVDDYLQTCAAEGIEPAKTYRGTFNVRISPDLHRLLAVKSASKGQSLNTIIEEAIKSYISV